MNYFKYSVTVFFIVSMLLSLGCSPKDYKNVSDDEQYRNLLGAEFKSKVELLGFGITFDKNYKQIVKYVFIMPRPGIAGPEVIFTKRVPKGLNFKVIGVLKSDRLFDSSLFYIIKFSHNELFNEYNVIIKVFDDIHSQNKGLDNNYFEYLGGSDPP